MLSSIELMRMLERGNFRLTKFVSNVRDVLATIPVEERTIKNLDLDKLPIQRALQKKSGHALKLILCLKVTQK